MQQPPYPPGPPPPYATPKPRRSLGKSTLILIGVMIVVALLLCGLCSLVVNATSNQASTDNPTPTSTGSHMVVSITQHSPTAVTRRATAKPAPLAPTPTPKPVVAPVQQPTPIPAQAPPATTKSGVNGNPWGYDFNTGTYITSPPTDFCSYFNCIKNFPNGRGYVVQCADGMYSKSGGIKESCSDHGGDKQALYAH